MIIPVLEAHQYICLSTYNQFQVDLFIIKPVLEAHQYIYIYMYMLSVLGGLIHNHTSIRGTPGYMFLYM